MELKEIRKRFDFLKEKGTSTGLTFQDYLKLRGFYEELCRINDPKLNEIKNQMNYILEQLRSSGIHNKFNSKNIGYIKEHADLLPLVLRDFDVIKFDGLNSVMFDCPFHTYSNGTFAVIDLYNTFGCKEPKCNQKGSSIDYVQSSNNLSKNKALELLCHIYNYEIKSQNPELIKLAEEYKNIIRGYEYGELLDKLEERLYKHNVYSWGGKPVEDLYKEKQKTIARVFSGESDPNFQYVAPPKLVKIRTEKKEK